MNLRFKIFCAWIFAGLTSTIYAQPLTRNVLFLGNSYTYVNNLPQLLHDFALNTGDTLLFQTNTPGGYTLDQHFSDPASTNKIITGGWDYVIMQEQSQLPALDEYLSNGGYNLCQLIQQYNPCARKMFYMTWGRKNGDASFCPSWPPVCTYAGMDSMLYLRYMEMAQLNNAQVSPVGAVWNYLRSNHPTIELYAADESHPSPAGSYAAAASFYASIFRKDPSVSTYNFSLNSADAAIIRDAAKIVVFDSLSKWDFSNHIPLADFLYHIGNGMNEVITTNNTVNADSVFWNWGDSQTSTSWQPVHNYLNDGNYTIELRAVNCDLDTIHTSIIQKSLSFCPHSPTIFPDSLVICPNASDTLWTQPYDSYQWLDWQGNFLAGETNQYFLPAGGNAYSVLSTLNNCTEQSKQVYVEAFSAGWVIFQLDSFSTSVREDTICRGDTVSLIVHPNRPGGGDFSVQWFKDGNVLAGEDRDTLSISSDGEYFAEVRHAACPLYVYYTSPAMQFEFLNCNIGVEEVSEQKGIILSPNPASERIKLNFSAKRKGCLSWEIFDIAGRMIKSGGIKTREDAEIPVSDLCKGIYFLQCRLDNSIYTGKFLID